MWTDLVRYCGVVLAMALVSSASAEEYYAKQGFYIGLFGVHNTLKGDFKGEETLYNADEDKFAIVPEVESGNGWGILIGTRGGNGAIELSYQRSEHDVSFYDWESEADYNIVNLDLKGYLFADKPVQPYLLLGFGYHWLNVKDGIFEFEYAYSKTEYAYSDNYYDYYYTTDYYTTSYEDATFGGFGFNLGGGLACYITPKICINGGAAYRWVSFRTIDGSDVEDSIDAKGIYFNVGMAYTF
jgi:opacity protein-like surface antigen